MGRQGIPGRGRLKGSGAKWECVAFRLPDDGTNALSLLRRNILDDDTNATYKFALLRAITLFAKVVSGFADLADAYCDVVWQQQPLRFEAASRSVGLWQGGSMPVITLLPSILDATDEDLIPIWGDNDEDSLLPTVDVFFASGDVELVHVGSVHSWLVTESYARFPIRQKISAKHFRDALRTNELLALLTNTVRAASSDSGIIAACESVNAYLKKLSAD